MWQRLRAIIRKEFVQTLRDRRTLLIVLIYPILLLFLMGYAVEMQVDHLPTVVVDSSRDQRSWQFLEAMESSSFFDLKYYVQSEAEAVAEIDHGRARVAIVIPPGFAAALERGDAQALVVVDGSDALTVQSAFNAAITVSQAHSVDLLTRKLERAGLGGKGASLTPLDVQTRVLYNPDIRSLVFMIPGLVALIMQQQAVSLTALAIVRERELGTIEQILVTPIRPWELMLGKILPNVVVTLFNMCTILALGVFWFKVPFQGNLGLFFGMALLFIFSSLGLGVLVSTVSTNQRQAQQLSALIQLPAMMLSGYIFPRAKMPQVIRWAGDLIPVTHFLQISRGIMTKGVGISYFQDKVWVLLFYGAVVFFLSAKSFKERLE